MGAGEGATFVVDDNFEDTVEVVGGTKGRAFVKFCPTGMAAAGAAAAAAGAAAEAEAEAEAPDDEDGGISMGFNVVGSKMRRALF